MKITKNELVGLNACFGGLKRFMEQTNNTDEPVDVSTLVGGCNTTSDLLWLAGKKLPKDVIVRFACDCALINIEFIRPYTNDYNLIVDFLNNPMQDAAADAADAAADAARAADAADAAAAAAAAAAADAAAYAAAYAAADAAAYAADAAADAADAAAYAINNLLIKMFNLVE